MEAVRRAKMERSTFRVPALHRVTIQKGQMAGRMVAGIRSTSGGTQQNGKGVVVGCMEICGRGVGLVFSSFFIHMIYVGRTENKI